MLSSQLFWRIFGLYAAFTICTAAGFVFVLSSRHRATVFEEVRTRLVDEARLVRETLNTFDGLTDPERLTEERAEYLGRIAGATSTRLTLFSPDGQQVWPPSDRKPFAPLNSRFERARLDEVAFSQDRTSDQGELRLSCLVRLGTSRDPRGYLESSVPLSQIEDRMTAVDYRLFAGGLLAGFLALLLTYLVVGRIIEPLGRLTDAAQDLAAGQLVAEVPVRSRNEIGRLAVAFNSMSRQLASRIAELQNERLRVQQNHQQLETVLGAMVEGVIAIDGRERIVFANTAARRLLDLTSSPLVDRPFWEVVRVPEIQRLVKEALTNCERQSRLEFEVARTQAVVGVLASPLSGNPCPGVVVVLHDVTELRRLERLRREFVSNVSHELKTPLASISAYAETLLDGGLEDPEANQLFISRILEQAERLHVLILDLLQLARLETHEETFDLVPTDVVPVLEASVEEHSAVARAKSIDLIFEAATDAKRPFVLADADGLRTIVDNLLDNAVNYTPPEGRVTVRWGVNQDEVWFEVEDTGVGIPRELQQRIFERFFRVDRARSREMGGTGLGLAIVKHLCQVFGGSVSVDSRLGKGSRFAVRLPASPSKTPSSQTLAVSLPKAETGVGGVA